MAIGNTSTFFVSNEAIDVVQSATRAVFDSPLKPGADQLAATKAETALMNGRALDAVAAPGSQTKSKVNARPEVSPTTPKPNLDAAVKRGQLGAARGQSADLGNAMSTFLKR
jgi:hypothetical protein